MAYEDTGDYTPTASLAAVALSGDYDDLIDKPTLGTMAAETASNYTPTSGLADVALSNDYNDLDNLPGASAATDTSPGYVSNNYYMASGIGHASAAYANEVFTTGTLYFYPFYVGKTASFKTINVRTVTGSAGNVVLGLYANSNGKPTGSPLENSGSISTASSGANLTYTFPSPRSLTGGTWYWVAVSTSSSTPTFVSIGPGSLGYVYTQNFLGSSSITGSDNSIIGYTQSFVYSATLPTVGSLSERTNGSELHCVWLQAN